MLILRLGSGRPTPGGCISRHLADTNCLSTYVVDGPYSYPYTLLLHLHPRPIHHATSASASDFDASSKFAFCASPRVEHNYISTSLCTSIHRTLSEQSAVLSLTSWATMHLAHFSSSTFETPVALLMAVTWPRRVLYLAVSDASTSC